MKPRAKGFSLMELMIVVAIVLIVGGISAPNIVQTLARYQTEASAREVHNILMRARYDAIRLNRNVSTVYVAPAGGAPAFYGIDLDNDGTLDLDEPRAQLTAGIVFRATAPPGTSTWTMGVGYGWAVIPASPAYSITLTPRGTPVPPVMVGWFGAPSHVLYIENTGKAGHYRAITLASNGTLKSWRWGTSVTTAACNGNCWIQ